MGKGLFLCSFFLYLKITRKRKNQKKQKKQKNKRKNNFKNLYYANY